MGPARHRTKKVTNKLKTVSWKPDLKALRGAELAARTSGESQVVAGESALVKYVNLVKLPHTVFALPFALVGVVYASMAYPIEFAQIVLVVVAFTAARFAAMGFNRVVDRKVDARNPRTRDRELPTGKLSARQARVSVGVASAVFVAAAGLLNPLCLALSLPALAWVLGYSYAKRITNWSHLWLGGALAVAPVGGYLAVAGRWSTPGWTLVILAIAVLLWVAGFDMFYALLDEHFDRDSGLRSAVMLLGRQRSIVVAKLFHGMVIALLIGFGIGAGFGLIFQGGVVAAAGILVWEHRLVRADDVSRVDSAFFAFNGIMSIVVFAGALLDRLVG